MLLRAQIRTPEERLFLLNGLNDMFHAVENMQAFHNPEHGEDLYAGLETVKEQTLQIIESMPVSEPHSFHATVEHSHPVQTAVSNWWPWGR